MRKHYKIGDRVKVDYSSSWDAIVEITEIKNDSYYFKVLDGTMAGNYFGDDSAVSGSTSLLESKIEYQIY